MYRLALLALVLSAALAPAFGQTYYFTPLAGHTSAGHADGAGRAALFNRPWDIAVHRDGTLFVTDRSNHVIRRITPAGLVSTIAGTPGQTGGNNGIGAAARFNFPQALAVDSAANVFVLDDGAIRKITPAGVVSTLAGRAGERGNRDGPGDIARFSFGPSPLSGSSAPFALGPSAIEGDIATDREGNLYIADTGNRVIRKVTAEGVVTTIAGQASGAGSVMANGIPLVFTAPARLTVDDSGNLYVTDRALPFYVHRISPAGEVRSTQVGSNNWSNYGVAVDRQGGIYLLASNGGGYDDDTGAVEKIGPNGSYFLVAGDYSAGTADGPRFSDPQGLAIDEAGNLFVADTGNHAIRRIAPDGRVTTVAGDPPVRRDGSGTEARFQSPDAFALDRHGNLFVSDSGALRRIAPDGRVTTIADAAITPGPYNLRVSLTFDPAGNVVIIDDRAGQRSLRQVSSTGEVTSLMPANGPRFPIQIMYDQAGSLYFSDVHTGLGKITAVGNVLRLADTPNGFVISSRGDVIFATSTAIRWIAGDGSDVTTIGLPSPSWQLLGVDTADAVYVQDRGALLKIAGGKTATLGTVPARPGTAFEWSRGFAVDAAGATYAIDYANRTLLKGVAVSGRAGDSRLVNASVLSTFRSTAPLVAGFSVSDHSAPLLVRAVGPGLRPFAPEATLASGPFIDLFDETASLQNWSGGWESDDASIPSFLAAGAFPLTSGDAALRESTVTTGSVQVTSKTPGLGLLEFYTLGATTRIRNVSVRQALGADRDATLVLGFTIQGPTVQTVLIRGLGPRLGAPPFNLRGPLVDPVLTVFNAQGFAVATNDNWDLNLASLFAQVGAFSLFAPSLPPQSKDAVLLLTLPPGNYSATLADASHAAGEAMIEIYEVW